MLSVIFFISKIDYGFLKFHKELLSFNFHQKNKSRLGTRLNTIQSKMPGKHQFTQRNPKESQGALKNPKEQDRARIPKDP